MTLSFRDYSTCQSLLAEDGSLDEGRLTDFLKKIRDRLFKSGKSKEEIEAAIAAEKEKLKKGAAEIAKTKQSQEFHARRAESKKRDAMLAARGTVGTVGTAPMSGVAAAKARLAATPSGDYNAAQARAAELAWLGDGLVDDVLGKVFKKDKMTDLGKSKQSKQSKEFHDRREAIKKKHLMSTMGAQDIAASMIAKHRSDKAAEREWATNEELISEGKTEFECKYQLRGGGQIKKWICVGRDVNDIRRKFMDSHYGAKLISVSPVKAKTQITPDDE